MYLGFGQFRMDLTVSGLILNFNILGSFQDFKESFSTVSRNEVTNLHTPEICKNNIYDLGILKSGEVESDEGTLNENDRSILNETLMCMFHKQNQKNKGRNQ